MSQSPPKVGSAAVLPLVLTTGVSLLATDLYLPSIPVLPGLLGGTLRQAQSTLPAFFVTFALCQLLHGALAERYGNFRVLLGAALVFMAATVLAAAAPSIEILVVARAFQGAGAAAATAIVPAVIRRTYDEKTSIRVLSWLGMAESVIPALGPLLGAFVLALLGWRANFWLLLAVAGVAAAMLVRNRPLYERVKGEAVSENVWRALLPNYAGVLSNCAFLAYALGYASAYGALMTFVGAAPTLLQGFYGHGPEAFGMMQVVMIAVFMAGSLAVGRSMEVLGRDGTIAAGLFFLALSAVLLLLTSSGILPDNAVMMTVAMLPSQFGLGLRFGVAMSAAIGSVPDRQSSASAMASFLCFIFAAAGNAVVALAVDHALTAVAAACLGFTIISLGGYLITPTTRRSDACAR